MPFEGKDSDRLSKGKDVPPSAGEARHHFEARRKATAHLTFEGMRDQYVGGVPRDIAERVDPRLWEEDWRIMSLPGRFKTQRALVLDYRSHVTRFGEIVNYLDCWQPSVLMLWGRHDIYFDLEETLSAHGGAHPRRPAIPVETHAAECGAVDERLR